MQITDALGTPSAVEASSPPASPLRDAGRYLFRNPAVSVQIQIIATHEY